MADIDRIRAGLSAAVSGVERGRAVADRLCGACVELLDIDGAALSIIHNGAISRSLGADGSLSRDLDELQFTFGEGPCLDAVHGSAPVLVPDLLNSDGQRWRAFSGAATARGVRALFALPVTVASFPIGALDLFRRRAGALDAEELAGGLLAAELAVLPLLDLMGMAGNVAATDTTSAEWEELSALTRVEVYQAAGMLTAQLGITPADAMIRLRGHAFAHDMTASEVAFEIISRRLRLGDDLDAFGSDRNAGKDG